MKMWVGVDLHKRQFTCYFMGENGKGKHREFETTEKGYELFLAILGVAKGEGCEITVGVESTGNTRYFKNRVEGACDRVVVVNTLAFKVVNESVNKTDRRDAKTIAEFLRKEMLPEAKMCGEKSEMLRRLVKTRKVLVQTCVALKNQAHGILLGQGIATKPGELSSRKGRAAVLAMIKSAENRNMVAVVMSSLDRVEEQVSEVEKALEEAGEEDPVIHILKSIPGTGLINATTVRAFIDTVERFSTPKKLAGYSGLAPWVQCSDQTARYGRITKRGPQELRTAFVQMVLGMVRLKSEKENLFVKRYYSIKRRKGSGKAIIAMARKMSRLVWTLLKNNEPYSPEKLHNEELWQRAEKASASAVA